MNSNQGALPSSREQRVSVIEVTDSGRVSRDDEIVIEEPIEIRLVFGPAAERKMRSVSITMRTPGHDDELAAGFLMTESILQTPAQIDGFQVRGVDSEGAETGNIVRVELATETEIDLGRLQRHFFTTSSCGVCGKVSLEALEIQGLGPITSDDFRIDAALVRKLPELLRDQQTTFERTGGVHAAGLTDDQGRLIASREDVGRHNAVDKLVGRQFLDGKTPLHEYGMIVSGRVSFEIMQKALAAGIPMVVAVGAPSSLAVEMADRYDMTLIGFTSAARFNIYAGGHRIVGLN